MGNPPFLSEIMEFRSNFKIDQFEDMFLVKNIKNICSSHISNPIIDKNNISFLFKREIYFPALNIPKYDLEMALSFLIEKQEPDSKSPLIWDFVCIKNEFFYVFSGRIRIKRNERNQKLKIGFYIEACEVKNEFLHSLNIELLKRIFRDEIREIFGNIQKFTAK